MHKTYCLLIGGLLACLFCQGQTLPAYKRSFYEAFISIEEAVTHFYNTHPDMPKSGQRYPHFEKRPDGWYAAIPSESLQEADYPREKIWDAKLQTFSLQRPERGHPDKRFVKNQAQQERQRWDYFIMPCYGYEGYEMDVIQLLEPLPVQSLNEDELEALARAYYQASNRAINPSYPNFSRYDSTFLASDIAPEKLKKSEDFAWKAIKIYEELAKRFPSHETLVGNINIKLGNEYIGYYQFFEVYQQPQIAAKFLSAARYSDNMVSIAKNYLMSCPANAILYTYGDNDTYPLLYAQAKLGFRTDVTILNSSLMLLGPNIYYNTQLLPEEKRIKHSLDLEHYKLNKNSYTSNNRQATEINDLPSFFKTFNANPNAFLYSPELDFSEINLQHFRLRTETKSIDCEYNGFFITKAELFLLDIICSNWDKRPICITASSNTSSGIYTAITPYCEARGFVYVLGTSLPLEDNNMPNIDLDSMLFKAFIYPNFEHYADSSYIDPSNLNLLLYLHGTWLWEKLIEDNLSENMAPHLKQYYKLFPLDKVNFGTDHSTLMLIHFNVDPNDPYIEKHFNAYIAELKQMQKKAMSPTAKALDKYLQRQEIFEEEYNRFVRFLEGKGWNDRVARLEKAFEK